MTFGEGGKASCSVTYSHARLDARASGVTDASAAENERKSAFYRRAAEKESIDICRGSAMLLANMAQMDECVEAICAELEGVLGSESSERVIASFASTFEVIKSEASKLLMYRMLDVKGTENI